MTLVLLVAGISSVPLAAWEYKEFSLDGEARLAMMASAGIWNPYLELTGTFHGADLEFRYNALTAGTYVRPLPWLKIGVFYSRRGGVRHLWDWTVIDNPSPTPDEQYWEKVSPFRYEDLILLDASPRFLMPFMPGRDWVGTVKIRYSYNFTNGHQTLLVRPALTWVLMANRQPLLNLSLQIPLYFALNYNDIPLYGAGAYVVGMWHLKDWMKLEGRLSYLLKNYEKSVFGGPWILHGHHLGIGLGIIFTPEFR